MLLPVPPTPQPQSLDDLLAQAAHYAEYSMSKFGRLTPALFLIGADGQLLMFVPDSLADDAAKDDFATTARLVCIAHDAAACVMVLEALAKFATPGEKLDVSEPPSEAFDRREVVVLMGESRETQRQKFLPILRSGNGRFFGFGEPDALAMGGMQGRFAQILPPKVPDEATREVVHAMLKVKGIAKAKSVGGPLRSRPRF